MQFETRNPFTDTWIASYNFAPRAEITRLIDKSHHAFLKWSNWQIDKRIHFIAKFTTALVSHREQLASIITLETAKPIQQSLAEIDKCIKTCEYYMKFGPRFLNVEPIHENAVLHYQPLGIVFGIMPWNYPVWQVLRFAIPTLLAGNTVIIKHAPSTPQCSLFIEKLFVDIDPEMLVYQQVFLDIADVEFVIANKYIRGVSLTGSSQAGRSVAQLAGKHLKKMVLELGGNDPFIVCEDADVELAASTAVESRCRNNGQSCIAAKRFIIHEDIFESFTDLLKLKLDQLSYGNPNEADIDISSLAREDLAQAAAAQIAKLHTFGFQLVYQKHSALLSSNTILPAIFVCNEQSKLLPYLSELFAPVFLIYKFSNIDEAVSIANNTEYGLGASAWTNNNTYQEIFKNQLQTGMLYFNKMVVSEAALPFGGIKDSGMGKELGLLGMREFVNAKLVVNKSDD